MNSNDEECFRLSEGTLKWETDSGLGVRGHAAGEALEILDSGLAGLLRKKEPGDKITIQAISDAMETGLDRVNAVAELLVRERIIVSKASGCPYGYHVATRDYPFLDMSTGIQAFSEDAHIMRRYLDESDSRPSPYLDIDPSSEGMRIAIPRPLDFSLESAYHSEFLRFVSLISLSFGEISKIWPFVDQISRYSQMMLLHKSVPSGGSRHPIELFIKVHKSPCLIPGMYHFNVRNNDLVLIEDREQAPRKHVTPRESTWYVEFFLAAAIERDMFRYRDPRSFRAVLVDAGHCDGQLAALSSFLNWSYASVAEIDINFGERVGADTELPLLIRGKITS